jgi:hypothetical protein
MKSQMQQLHVQNSISTSIYVLFAFSIVSAFMSLIFGSFIIISLFKIPFGGSSNTALWFPPLLNGIGFISGLIAKHKTKTMEVSPADGCAVGLSIYFNIIILIVYLFLVLSIGLLVVQSWA